VVVSNAGAGPFTLRQMDCSTKSVIRKYVSRIYYVSSCGTCSPSSDGMPTLKMAELVASGGALIISTRTLAPGIENVHFEYGVDSTGSDGGVDLYSVSNEDPINTSPGFDWQNVMAVKVWVLVRDMDNTAGYSNGKEYVLGGRTLPAFNDSWKRSVFASTVRLVNPSGAREQP
jgi:type IV pilus assembly protein PilW